MSFDVFLCFTIPIVWILSALFAHCLFVRRGYPQSDSWLPGCLLGPLGVFIAALMPHESPRARYWLQFVGLFFAFTVLGGILTSFLYFAAKGLLLLGLGLFILFEVANSLIVRGILQRNRASATVDSGDPVQKNVSPNNRT